MAGLITFRILANSKPAKPVSNYLPPFKERLTSIEAEPIRLAFDQIPVLVNPTEATRQDLFKRVSI